MAADALPDAHLAKGETSAIRGKTRSAVPAVVHFQKTPDDGSRVKFIFYQTPRARSAAKRALNCAKLPASMLALISRISCR